MLEDSANHDSWPGSHTQTKHVEGGRVTAMITSKYV